MTQQAALELLIVRHADAGSADKRKYPDDSKRPLSAEGKRDMLRGANGMRRVGLEFDAIYDSGFVRARQTSICICQAFDIDPSEVRTLLELEPEADPAATAAALRKLRGIERVALVGHLPQLGRLIGHLVADNPDLQLDIKKGGVCRLESDKWSAGSATLIAVLPPKILRAVAK